MRLDYHAYYSRVSVSESLSYFAAPDLLLGLKAPKGERFYVIYIVLLIVNYNTLNLGEVARQFKRLQFFKYSRVNQPI